MIAAAVLAMVVAGTVPGATLDVTSVDASAYPTVAIEFVVPEPYAAVELTPAMVDVDGVPADALAPVDAASVVVHLVVDDGPAVLPDVVGASQGAAVEFVRNIAIGTRIAVGTPSGLQTAATADPGATIARIAAITAGAPAVTSLPDLIRDSAAALAADGSTDRHLVVALGGPLEASDAQMAEIAEVIVANGITLHLLRSAGAPEPALTMIAEQSGGFIADAADTLAFFDTVTAAISNRYRITTTLTTPGDHVVGLTVDGVSTTAHVDVQQPAVASEAPVPETPASTAVTVPAVEVDAAPPIAVVGADVDTALSDDDAAVSDDDTAVSDDGGGSLFGPIAVALEIAMVVFVVVWLVLRWRRRWRHREDDSDASSQPTSERVAVATAAEPPPANDVPEVAVAQPQTARTLPTRTIRQPLPAREPAPALTSDAEPAMAARAGSQAEPVPDSDDAGSDPVSPTPTTKRRPSPTPKPAVESLVAAESDAAETQIPKPKRTPKERPAVEQVVVAASDAAKAPVSKPKPKRRPSTKSKPVAEQVGAAASDAATEPASKPKPKRAPKPKPAPKLRIVQDNDRAGASEPELIPEATATREPIVDQTPVLPEREPIVDQTPVLSEREPIDEPTPDRDPDQQAASAITTDPVDATDHPTARALPSSRPVRRRAERVSTSQRTRRGARRGSEPAVASGESSVASDWLVVGSLRFRPANGEVWAGRHQVHLTPSELAILELLMTSGNRGVAEADIIAAGGLEPDGRDIADTLARIRRKTGFAGRGQSVRRERVMLYFLDDDTEGDGDTRVSHRRGRTSVRR